MVIYIKIYFVCHVYNGSMIIEEVEHLYSSHEETDNRMSFHAHQCEVPSSIVIRTNNTDYLVTALGCKHNLDPRASIWLETGKESRNDQWYININQLHQYLGAKFVVHMLSQGAYTILPSWKKNSEAF